MIIGNEAGKSAGMPVEMFAVLLAMLNVEDLHLRIPDPCQLFLQSIIFLSERIAYTVD